MDRTGHSRNKLDRYTVLQSCLEFNRDTISCASSPTGPRHLLIRESVAWQWLFRWFITVPRDMSAGQFPRRSRGTFSLGRIYGFRRLCPRTRTVDTTSLNYSPLAISRSIDPLNRRIAADFFWDKRYAQGSVRGYPSEEKLMYELLVGDSCCLFLFLSITWGLFYDARGYK